MMSPTTVRGPSSIRVKIRVLEEQRRDIDTIGRLTVPAAGGPVRIDNIAQIERGFGPSMLQPLTASSRSR